MFRERELHLKQSHSREEVFVKSCSKNLQLTAEEVEIDGAVMGPEDFEVNDVKTVEDADVDIPGSGRIRISTTG